MRSATAIRETIESSLAARIPPALSPRLHQATELLPTGIAEVDALLQGGLPVGSLTEITGPDSSGRSTLVAAILAGANWNQPRASALGTCRPNSEIGQASMGVSRSGVARNGLVAECRRLSHHCARYGRCLRRTGAACAFGLLVSLSAAGRKVPSPFPASGANPVCQQLHVSGFALHRGGRAVGICDRKPERLAAADRASIQRERRSQTC